MERALARPPAGRGKGPDGPIIRRPWAGRLRRRQLVALGMVLAVVAAGLVPNAATQLSGPLMASEAGFSPGGQIFNFNDAELARELDSMVAAGGAYVRFDVPWSALEPNAPTLSLAGVEVRTFDWPRMDRLINAAHARGLQVVALPAYTPAWARPAGTTDKHPPNDPQRFATFVQAAVKRYAPQGVKVWEIWNEPNLSIFWSPKPDPVGYTTLLKATATAIRAADPSVTIMTAGLAPASDAADGTQVAPVTFIESIYAHGGKGSFDAVGMHPYSYPARPLDPTTATWNPFYRLPLVYDVMVANGDGAKKIWATEYGAPTGTGSQAVSEAEQAAMVTDAYNGINQWPWTGPLLWYSHRNLGGDPADREQNFGIRRLDFTAKPALSTYTETMQEPLPSPTTTTTTTTTTQPPTTTTTVAPTTTTTVAPTTTTTVAPTVVVAPKSPDFNGDGFADQAVGVPYEDVDTAADAGGVNVLYGSAAGLTGTASQSFTQGNGGVAGGSEPNDHFGWALAWGNFNGDRYDDLAVGAPEEDVGTLADAGRVTILLGSATGLTGAGSHVLHQDVANVADTAEAGDRLGAALASGDVNADGKADLAVGVPNEDVGSKADAGGVTVLFGSVAGVGGNASQAFLTQDTANVADSSEAGDRLGSSLAVGDFNKDGKADLASGAPDEDVGSVKDAGGVTVLFGSATVVVGNGSQALLSQNASNVADTSESGDRMGAAVAAGDLNGDGRADLVAGTPNEDVGALADAGGVTVLFGSATVVVGNAGQPLLTQDSPNVADASEAGDRTGAAVAVGDFNGDGRADLAAGAPDEDVGSLADAGGVSVLFGSATVVVGNAGQPLLTQDSPNVADASEAGDRFGAAVVAADYNRDGRADVMAGAPNEDVAASADAGGGGVLAGSASAVVGVLTQVNLNQETPGVPDDPEAGDRFGSSL